MYQLTLELPYQVYAYQIFTNDDELIRTFIMYYGIDNCFGELKEKQRKIYKISAVKKGLHYTVSIDDDKWEGEMSIRGIQNYIYAHSDYPDKYLALHGSNVVYKDAAYIFLSPTNCGKTTLTVYLDQNGMLVSSDDCSVIRVDTGNVLPIAMPFHLRTEGLTILKRCLKHSVKTNCVTIPGTEPRYVYNPINRFYHEKKIKRMYYIIRTETNNSVFQLSKTEAFETLLKSVLQPKQLTSKYIKKILRLSNIEIAKIYYSNMEFVKTVLESDNYV